MSESSFRLQLDRIANGGYALGRHDGQVVFVSYAIPGETVEVRLVEQKQNFVRGVPSAVLEASRERVTPLCPHFGPGLCGGCQWQHITYEAQLRYKQAIVIDQFERVGKFSDPPVRPAIGNPAPWGYRSYATFTIAGDGQSGYYTDDNSAIIPVEVCHILHPALVELYGMLDLGDAQIKRIKYQVGSDESDRMIILETEDDLPPEIETDLPVSINLLLSDNEPVNLLGQSHVTYHVRHRRFRVTAGSFFQVSTVMADVLVDQVLQALSLQGGETILDLYSGVGLFTAFIAEQAGLVVSVESYPPAVTDADENLTDLENVDLIEGGVEAVLDDLDGEFDAAVMDPPRAGLSREAVSGLLRLRPRTLVYVSCDPATLARDARILCAEGGYRLESVQPVDMFAQTFHIENIAVFRAGQG